MPTADASRGRADPAEVDAALARLAAVPAGEKPPRADLKLLVKHSLAVLASRAPGRAVEVRVPPYAAVQAVAGPRHGRGTPPAVVETDPQLWIALATGATNWAEALTTGRLHASGQRSDLSALLPLLPPMPQSHDGPTDESTDDERP
jgi:hypothetical protein